LRRVIVCGIPDNPKTPHEPAPKFQLPPLAPEAMNEQLPVPPPHGIDETVFARIYEEHCGLLVSLAVRKFQVPAVDAEALAHEVFLSYLRHADEVRDLRHWLIGAICNASRYYWRKYGRNIEQLDTDTAAERPDPQLQDVLTDLPNHIAVAEVLEAMPPRWAHILRLRYFEGYSIKEIAEHLGVTSKYTQKLVAKCLHRAEEIFDGSRARKKV
jgi:RNA polymerase sigma-70 factor (ECF subfamily)